MFIANSGTAGVPDIITSLFPNLPNFIAHVIATIVLVAVISKLIYKPFRKVIKERRAKINELLAEAVYKQTEANVNAKKSEEILENSKKESSLIIQASKIDADVQKTQIIQNAHNQAEIIKLQANKDIDQKKSQIESELRNTIVEVAFNAAEQILKKEISKDSNKKMIDEFIEGLDN
ncbi:F0F1 ATP synthase subunit B [Entomoplasma ellychniae]|uniref:ATP synthase subunit b n=1 Tax=Entomoplasma ellychniae TaxID=2114 RepID=A0A8E2QWC1_9MOLU|nr:F0F1 ATP synthase subunit B [Entomoplasma ellychniae]PPE04887.1 F0F1 ATP synthase subunit B [Entomoplasma ellychniae]